VTLSRERCRGTLQSHNNSEEGSKKLAKSKPDVSSAVAEKRWKMKQFGRQVVGYSTPAMQRQDQEWIAALTGQQASWW